MKATFCSCLLLFSVLNAQEKAKGDPLAGLDLPGVTLNLSERSVDVQATIAIDEGALEFVACTADTKEHESALIVQAKPSHIHTALLLLGAKAGHPAMRKLVGEGDNERVIDLPPKGSPITVSIVIPTKETGKEPPQAERPLTDFIKRNEDLADQDSAAASPSSRLKTFLFAGSHLRGKGDGPKTYLADKSGSVISLSTFGDELLCLPGVIGHANHALQWELDPTHLPPVGTKVTLRLRPTKKTPPPK